MNRPNTMTAMVTLFSFLMGMPVSAQTASYQGAPGTDAAQYGVPTYTPFKMNMASPMTNMQAAMAGCQTSILAGDKGVQNLFTKGITGSKVTPDVAAGNCGVAQSKDGRIDASKFKCGMTCDEPVDLSEAPSCDKYYQENTRQKLLQNGDEKNYTEHVFVNKDLYATDKAKVELFVAYGTFKASKCVAADQEALKAQLDAYNCQMKVLQSATADASAQLQQALQQNNQQYGKMNQFIQQVGDQMRQIDDILGPEDGGQGISKIGGDQFQGLLGMQKTLNTELARLTTDEATFKTSVDQIQNGIIENEQNLESGRMSVVSGCMKGERNIGVSGGRSLMCFKPVQGKNGPSLDASGNPVYAKQSCGPMEYIRSQVEQAAFVNGNRGVIVSQDRRDIANANTTQFDALLTSINRDMGDYDQPTDANGKAVGDKPAPRVVNWNTLSTKYAADIQELSAKTGVNIGSQLNTVANHCFSDSYTWKNQQQRSANSSYNKKKAEITKMTNTLTADLNNGLSKLNGFYGSASAVLWNQASTLNRFSCTTTDPAKMASCYTTIKQNVQSLLEGNGSITASTKNISGGTMIPNLVVSCRGINGCVTAYQNVRKAKKEQTMTAQKAKAEFVQSGNAQIQSQLSAFAGQLNNIQSTVLAQFDGMRGLLAKMGVDAPERPKFMESEQLEPSMGQDKQEGPFKSPKSMASVLSGLTQPTGLINFQDSGVRELVKNAQEKLDKQKTELKEKIKSYAQVKSKIDGMNSECKKGDVPQTTTASTSKNVNNDIEPCTQAQASAVSAKKDGSTDPMANSISLFDTVVKAFQYNFRGKTLEDANQLESKLTDLRNTSDFTGVQKCLNSFSTAKEAKFNPDATDGKAAGAATN